MAQQETNRSRGWLWAIIAIAVLVAAVWGLRSWTRGSVPVRTARVEYQEILRTVSTNGKVEPVEDFQAHAPAPGQVQKLLVHVDDKVTRGQELVRMDVGDAQSRIASARATLEGAQTTLQNMLRGGTQDENLAAAADLTTAQAQERQAAASVAALQALQAKGAASAAEVQKAQQQVSDAHAKVAQLQARRTGRYSAAEIATQRAQIDQARAALSAAQAAYASVDIRAPFGGTVYSIPIADYDYVQAGETLLDLADLTHIQVRAYFDEPEIGNLADGQPVSIVWDARPNQTWHGHVLQAPTTIITYNGTRNVGECLITVDDARGDLLPNTNVTVKVTTLQVPHVLSVPREALRTEGSANYVYKIVNGRLARAKVQTGIVTLTRAEITGGLSEGDEIVLGAAVETDLHDGLQVKAQH